MYRSLKRYLAPLLPGPWIDYLKSRCQSRVSDGVASDFKLDISDTSIQCTIIGSSSFLMPRECECEYELTDLTTSQDARLELSGIARLASAPGGTLFDIGANVGIISALFCASNPANRSYGFEPSPSFHDRFRTACILNHLEGRMFLQPFAIGKEKATLEMLIDPASGYVQAQRFKHSMWETPRRIEVSVETIPDASDRLGVIPDLIKLDIEGYEYEAICGAQSFLSKHKPVLLLELHLNYLDERNLSAKELVSMLTSCGYSFFTHAGTALRPREIYDSPLSDVHILARATG
ncbi:MAG: FkbM family methyltransferase [Methylacidiphilales bacterium]|nr:FkbM family methyltransferase [Candidatus Methylacidiphilales bacterium]